MILIFLILQVIFVKIGWWVYRVYFTEPKYSHPPIFWKPHMRLLLAYGPSTGMLGLAIAAFFLTTHPWYFLLFTLVFWGYCGHKYKHMSPSMTTAGASPEREE